MKYRAEIDGLRAVAVLPVIFFHAGFELFSGGYVGVDIFFVISGYLITTIILNEMDEGRFSVVNFYERRARRILPALFIVLLCSLPFALLWLTPRDLEDYAQSLIAVVTFSSNILFWRESGYFATASELKPLLHTWSLAVEEQYYIFFPLFLMAVWRFGKKALLSVLVIIFVASIGLALWAVQNEPTAAFFLLPTRGWEILLGAFCAFYLRDFSGPSSIVFRQIMSVAGLLLIAFAVFAFDKHTPVPSLYTLVPTIGTALLILFASQGTIAKKILSASPFVGVGLISYSTYLWHQPLFAFARIRFGELISWEIFTVLSLVSLGLGYMSWKFIEKPFRNKRVINRSGIFYASSASILIFAVIGFAGHASDGFKNIKLSSEQIALFDSGQPSPRRTECHTRGLDYLKPDQSCEYIRGDKTIAVFGDSHVVELAYALATEIATSDIKVKHLSFSGCFPAYNRGQSTLDEGCVKWTNEAVPYINKRHDIKTVVLSYRIAAALHGDHAETFPNHKDTVGPLERDLRWKSYVDVMKSFLAHDKRVILVLQAPELPRHIHYLLGKGDSHQDIRGVSRSWWQERMKYVSAHIDEIPDEVVVIDPSISLCDADYCSVARDGVAYYFDNNHLSVAGAKVVVKKIVGSLIEMQ